MNAEYTLDRPGGALRQTFMSEWVKFLTVRATVVMVAVAFASAVAIGALTALTTVQRWDEASAGERETFDAVSSSLVGVVLSTLVLGALAVRSMTAEYTSGMIATTLVATPDRRSVLTAKAVIAFGVGTVIALLSNLTSFAIGQTMFAREGIEVGLGDQGVWRAIVAGAIAVGLLAIVAVALGTVFRRAAPANIVLSLMVLGGQLLGLALPESARRFLPSAALEATVAVVDRDDLIAPSVALAMLVIYAAVATLGASRQLARRDA